MLTPTRYVQRPPEVRALLIADETIDAACVWLAEHGRDAYREQAVGQRAELVVIGRGKLGGFRVPAGWYLLHDGHAFRTCTAEHFAATYEQAEPAGSHARAGGDG